MAVTIFNKYGLNLYALNIFLLISTALIISIIDLKTLLISNFFLIIFLLLSIYPIILNNSLKDNFYGSLLMFLFFLIILFIFPGSFGGGDLKLATLIGLVLGLKLSLVALETSLISGALLGTIYAFWKKKSLRIKIAFAPFLTLGLIVAWLYGQDLILIYYKVVF